MAESTPEIRQAGPLREVAVRRANRPLGRVSARAATGGALLLVALCCAALASGAQTANTTNSSDWPQMGYDTARTNFNLAESALSPDRVPALTPSSTSTVGSGLSLPPTVANGAVYAINQGTLYAFPVGCSATCTASWTAAIGSDYSAPPTVWGGDVLVARNDGRVDAFDASGDLNCSGSPKTCTPVWKMNVAGAQIGAPAVAGNILYLTSGELGNIPPYTRRLTLAAFDATNLHDCDASCQPLWVAGDFTGSSNVYVVSPATVDDGEIFQSSLVQTPNWNSNGQTWDQLSAWPVGGGNCDSESPKVCTPAWTDKLDITNWPYGACSIGQPTAVAGVVYLVSCGEIHAFDASTGTELWQTSTGASISSLNVAVADGVVYAGTQTAQMLAFDVAHLQCSGSPSACTPSWRTASQPNEYEDAQAPVVADGVVYTVATDDNGGANTIYAYPVNTTGSNCSGTPTMCSPIWSASLSAYPAEPTAANGVLYAATSDGKITAFTPDVGPAITSFSPGGGLARTTVTITGANLGDATAVSFNGTAAKFSVVSTSTITATVPTKATSGAITVTTPEGQATSSTPFYVVGPPSITSFSPSKGGVGATVIVSGKNLALATALSFNGTGATFTATSATKLTATVPSGASTGKLEVATPAGNATSAKAFTVVPTPIIESLSPLSAGAGMQVVITGAAFTGATTVAFNGVKARFKVTSDTRVVTTVPKNATTGAVRVTTSGGSATSSDVFTVVPTPSIASFAPTSGPVGSSITVAGSHLSDATGVKLGGVSVSSFTVNSDSQVTLTVPAGAKTGRLAITTAGGVATSAKTFKVTNH